MSIFYSMMECVAARCVQHKELCGFTVGVTTTSVWDTCSVRFYISDCAVKDEIRVKDGRGKWRIWEE